MSAAPWERCPLRTLVRVLGGGTPNKERLDYWTDGTIPWVSPKDMKRDVLSDAEDHITHNALRETAVRLVPVGSVLVVVRGMILSRYVPVALTASPVTLNQDMKALVPLPALEGRFLRYALTGRADELMALVEEAGHGTKCLRSELLFNVQVAVPPLAEQRRIADFLDARCAAIDAAIEKKERMLEAIECQWTSWLRDAVQHRGSPTAKLKTLVSTIGGGTPSKDLPRYWAAGTIPWVTPKDMKRDELFDAEDRITREAVSETAVRMIPADSVLVVVRGMILAHSFPVGIARVPVTVNQDMKALLAGPRITAEFLAWTLRAMRDEVLGCVDRAAHGTCCIETDRLFSLRIGVPPLDAQTRIAEECETRRSAFSRLTAALTRSIAALREYRTALITAAVTGQLPLDAPPTAEASL